MSSPLQQEQARRLKLIENHLKAKKDQYRSDTFSRFEFKNEENLANYQQYYETFKQYYDQGNAKGKAIHTAIKEDDFALEMVMGDLAIGDIYSAYKASEFNSQEYSDNFKDMFRLYFI